jgi:hypothetical protein
MDDDERQGTFILLPVTMAEHRNAGLYFDESAFSGRQIDSARKKK